MELDELKSKLDVSDVLYSASELNDIFAVKTKHAVNRINRKMWWDAVFMVLTAATLIVTTFLIGLRDRYLISSEIIILSAALFIHYRIKYYLLNKINFEEKFNHAVTKVRRRLRVYMRIYEVVIPLGIAALYLNIQIDLIAMKHTEALDKIIRLGFTLPLISVVYVLTKKLVHLIYGPDLEKLNTIVNEMKA